MNYKNTVVLYKIIYNMTNMVEFLWFLCIKKSWQSSNKSVFIIESINSSFIFRYWKICLHPCYCMHHQSQRHHHCHRLDQTGYLLREEIRIIALDWLAFIILMFHLISSHIGLQVEHHVICFLVCAVNAACISVLQTNI